MDLEDSKSSSEFEMDRSSENNDDIGTGRSYECVFCKRGFTTAQALGGHMNIHRKDRANNKTTIKPNFISPSSSITNNNLHDDHSYNYPDLGFYSPIVARGQNYYSTTAPDREVDASNYHHVYFPSHVEYSEVLCVENQRVRDHQDWRQRGLGLYTNNPLCIHDNHKGKIIEEETELDLELRLGYHHP